MQGLFNLKTPEDLREKLRRELVRLKAEPLNADHAFNFFVTALHMLDWIYPGKPGTPAQKLRQAAEDKEVLLQISSSLGNGAKHFSAEPFHKTVASTERTRSNPLLNPVIHNPVIHGGFRPRLVVILDGDASVEFGPKIGAIELAEKVMSFWDSHSLT